MDVVEQLRVRMDIVAPLRDVAVQRGNPVYDRHRQGPLCGSPATDDAV
jgi:hypothetical protein